MALFLLVRFGYGKAWVGKWIGGCVPIGMTEFRRQDSGDRIRSEDMGLCNHYKQPYRRVTSTRSQYFRNGPIWNDMFRLDQATTTSSS